MKPLQIPLEEGKFYHIYNRGNNGENLFYNQENYKFFLRKLDEYVSDYIELYAFSLMPNHFHLLVQIKVRDIDALRFQNAKHLEEAADATDALHFRNAKRLKYDPASLAFLKLFTSYSKAINKQQKRHGSLFENPFKRKEIDSTTYLANLVFYIHANPQLHGISDDFRQYPWSSYDRILLSRPSKLQKERVIEWFSNKDNYLAYHNNKIDIEEIKELLLE